MKRLLAALLLAAGSAGAQPVITSVFPPSVPAEGAGMQVTIKGTGFHECLFCNPPAPGVPVFFGKTMVYGRVVNETTMHAIAPAHLPGTVDVTVSQDDGSSTLPNALTFVGDIEGAFERVLLPLFIPPVNGAFGSHFVTELRVANPWTSEVEVIGLLPRCSVSACVFPDPAETLYPIVPGDSREDFEFLGRPGWFLYVPNSSRMPAMNLRVFDSSRGSLNFGTEIPVVQEREFTVNPFQLLGVPLDPRFRNTLRIYATGTTSVSVRIGDRVWHVPVVGGANPLEPAYAQFSEFPVGGGTVDVTIVPQTVVPPMPGLVPERVWAFISVTNNETQLITTISPQR